MSQGGVRLEHRGPVAWITVDNPAKRNAVSLSMWAELDAHLATIGEDTRCIVLRGEGDKAFVSGADISEFAEQRRSAENVRAYDRVADMAMDRLYNMSQPTIAMIYGYCFGGGMALALSCDLRMAEEGALFSVPAARLGLGYGAPGLKKLLDVVSPPVALDIMASARRIGAAEALSLGLLNQVRPKAALADEVETYVAQIVRNAPLTVRAAKRAIRELSRANPAADMELCRQLAEACFASDDYAEGARAFMEKREPRFTGR